MTSLGSDEHFAAFSTVWRLVCSLFFGLGIRGGKQSAIDESENIA
jgi:hypothetical protein